MILFWIIFALYFALNVAVAVAWTFYFLATTIQNATKPKYFWAKFALKVVLCLLFGVLIVFGVLLYLYIMGKREQKRLKKEENNEIRSAGEQ